MSKVSLDFSTNEYSDAELSVKASTVAGSLDGNVYFPSLAPNVTTIKDAVATFDDLLAQMAEGNKKVTAEKNLARETLVEVLCEAGRLVQNISKGDEVQILSSGFDMNRKPTPIEILDQPGNVTVKPGKIPGTLDVSWDVVSHARSYEVRYTKLPKSDPVFYEKVTSSKHKITLEGLVQGQQYAIQVAGVGSNPKRVWSFEISSFVM
ncbi:MAG: fibronectin type III domain-containing protein [Bacteroidales bacterium]|nr:fibronectin type III domain-containing protein [Bacteroidales bacterium]